VIRAVTLDPVYLRFRTPPQLSLAVVTLIFPVVLAASAESVGCRLMELLAAVFIVIILVLTVGIKPLPAFAHPKSIQVSRLGYFCKSIHHPCFLYLITRISKRPGRRPIFAISNHRLRFPISRNNLEDRRISRMVRLDWVEVNPIAILAQRFLEFIVVFPGYTSSHTKPFPFIGPDWNRQKCVRIKRCIIDQPRRAGAIVPLAAGASEVLFLNGVCNRGECAHKLGYPGTGPFRNGRTVHPLRESFGLRKMTVSLHKTTLPSVYSRSKENRG
jgi:hypothetical protein